MKKVMSVLLSVAMLLTVTTGINLTAFADTYSGTCGESVTWSLDSESGEMIISGYGDMTDFKSGEAPWYEYKDIISSISFSPDITHIGNWAFYNCKNLISVSLPENNSLIGAVAFAYCTSLEGITIPDSYTYIDMFAFSECTNLAYVNFPDTLETISFQAFSGCTSLTEITLPESLVDMPNAFVSCSALTDVYYLSTKADFDNIIIGLVDQITGEFPRGGENAFSSSVQITCTDCVINSRVYESSDGIYKYKLITPQTVEIYQSTYVSGGAYYEDVTVPDLIDGKTVVSIGFGSFSTSDFYSITLSDNITEIRGNAFLNSFNMGVIVIPVSVTVIGSNAFYRCSDLTDVYYSGTQEEWNNISIADGNISLTSAVIHCTDGVINEPATDDNTDISTGGSTSGEGSTTTPSGNNSGTTSDNTSNINTSGKSDTGTNTTTDVVTNTATTNAVASATVTTATTDTTSVTKPKKTKIKKLKKAKKSVKATWKKVSGVTGYQVQVATNKKFTKNKKTVTVKGASKTSKTIKKLKSKKTYYVRIRTYKTVNGKKVYSKWSTIKKVTTK